MEFYLQSDQKLWCNANTYKPLDTLLEWESLTEDLIYGESSTGSCSVPCQKTMFHSKYLGSTYQICRYCFKRSECIYLGGNDKATWKGITLFFDKVIETKNSEFQMNARTMMSFIGGIVGYCKNALWIIILLSSSLSYTIYALRKFIAHGCSSKNKSFV